MTQLCYFVIMYYVLVCIIICYVYVIMLLCYRFLISYFCLLSIDQFLSLPHNNNNERAYTLFLSLVQ